VPYFIAETNINAPIETVWAFHEAPNAIERLTPPAQGIRLLSRQGGLATGARVVFEIPILGPFKMQWHALHTACDPPNLFVDEQQRGPFSYWRHEHRFASLGPNRTQLTDHVEFRILGGRLVNAMAAPIIRLQLRQLFKFRHQATKNYCE
jgi:ligand-binding SRPBCC domain-containing protein